MHTFTSEAHSSETRPPLEYSNDQLLGHAAVLEDSGDLLLARTLYSYVHSRSAGKSGAALRGLGACHLALGDADSALKAFQQLIDISPGAESYLALAKAFCSQPRDENALEALRRIERPHELSKEQHFEYLKIYGNCLARTGRLDEAGTAFNSAIALKPSNDSVRVNLGMLELLRKNIPLAVSAFAEAKRINPRNVKAMNGLGLAAMEVGDWKSASAHFNASLDASATNSTAALQLLVLTASGIPMDPVAMRCELLLELDPENSQVRYHLATAYLDHKKWRLCEHHLSVLIQKRPDHLAAQRLYSQLRNGFQTRGGLL